MTASVVRGVLVIMGGKPLEVGVAGVANSGSFVSECTSGICAKSSSVNETCEALEGAPDGGISTGARSNAALSCSFSMVISSFASDNDKV